MLKILFCEYIFLCYENVTHNRRWNELMCNERLRKKNYFRELNNYHGIVMLLGFSRKMFEYSQKTKKMILFHIKCITQKISKKNFIYVDEIYFVCINNSVEFHFISVPCILHSSQFKFISFNHNVYHHYIIHSKQAHV